MTTRQRCAEALVRQRSWRVAVIYPDGTVIRTRLVYADSLHAACALVQQWPLFRRRADLQFKDYTTIAAINGVKP